MKTNSKFRFIVIPTKSVCADLVFLFFQYIHTQTYICDREPVSRLRDWSKNIWEKNEFVLCVLFLIYIFITHVFLLALYLITLGRGKKKQQPTFLVPIKRGNGD